MTLAQIPRIFSEADSSNNPSLPLEDVAWGFLIGLVSDDVDHKQPDGQYEEITEILEKCSELADGRKQYAKSAVDHMESKPASTAIKELGYKPTSAIKSHLIRKTNFEEPNTVEEYKEIFEPAFEEMEKSVRFQFYLDLIRDIEEDYEELTNRGWNNFKYISLIRILGQEDSPVDQQDIAEQLGSNTEEAVKMLRDLAGEAKDTIGKNYDDKPFVKRENGESLELNESGEVIKTYEGTKWELTKYGTLFYQVTEVDDKGYDMLYSLGIQPKYNSNEDHFLIRDIFREHYGRQDIDDDPEYPDDTVYRYDTL